MSGWMLLAVLACDPGTTVEARAIRWSQPHHGLMRALDQDGSGSLTEEEIAGIDAASLLVTLDLDGDGSVSEEELQSSVDGWRVASLLPSATRQPEQRRRRPHDDRR